MSLNDPLVPFQWYLDQTNSVGGSVGFRDLGGLQSVWADYIGRGIRVGIYDSGVDVSHPDLAGNYLSSLNPTFNGLPLDPTPTTGAQGAPDAHGTSVAGIIAGVANNNVGIAGIAYGAKFGVGLTIGSRNSTSVGSALVEQMRLQTNFDVVNHSWGYSAPFTSNQDSGLAQDQDFMQAIADAAQNGRNGLGTIMVVSAGNGREDDVTNGNGLRGPNSSNDQSFENSRFVITVAAADRNGVVSSYSDPGAANFITGFGGPGEGGAGNSNVFSSDIVGAAGYNNGSQQIANQLVDASFSGFNGTSAAAPTVTGVIALMLEARPSLGWRDVKEILALSAVHTGSAIGATPAGPELYPWRFNGADYWNGGGLHTSEDYGFGLVNARNAVRLAETWSGTQRSSNEVKATASVNGLSINVPDNHPTGSSINFSISSNLRVETVELKLSFNAQRSRDLRLDLISPYGTTITLIKDLGDAVTANVNQPVSYSGAFTFSATGFMGEKAAGNWQARIIDTQAGEQISVSSAILQIYGEENSINDTYFYNDEFALVRSLAGGPARGLLIDNNGGVDTLNGSQLSASAVINLNEGANSALGGSTLIIGQGSSIENAIGGDGHDALTGNGLDNLLRGMRGNDTLSGGAGNDTLEGGGGNDDLAGGEGNDVLNGGDGVDSLNGGAGDDALDGGKGSNVLDGGQGNDTLLGGAEADFLYGGDGNDSIRGLDGDDLIRPDAGNDIVQGGLGKDIARYSGVRTDVTVSRAQDGSYTVNGAAAGSDQLFEVERISFDGGGAYVLDASSIVMPLALVLKNAGYQPMDSATLVYRLYAAAYARTPDEGGFVFWANRALAGDVAADVLAQQFRLAPEFTQKYGASLDDRTYTDKLYSNVLGRPSDQAGLDFWTNHLTQNYYSRDQLMTAFAVSPENVTRTLPDVSNGYWVL